MSNKLTVTVAGDLFISDEFRNKKLIDKSVENIFSSSDFNIVNQEAPITNNVSANKILKTGPHLWTSGEATLPILKQLKINLTSLANNHIMDYGSIGLNDTHRFLQRNNIGHTGTGNTIKEASACFTLSKNRIKLGILNFAENEWASAGNDRPGAYPLDIIDNVRQISYAKKNHDKVIVIIHGGHEYYDLPSPRMVKLYRYYAEQGADFIIGHHTHCISGYENYKGTPIFYSLGNFLMTIPSKFDSWYNGLILKLQIERNEPIQFSIVPVIQEKTTFKTSIPKNDVRNIILKHFEKVSETILDEDQLTLSWNNFVKKRSDEFIARLSPLYYLKIPIISSVIHRFKLYKLFNSKRQFISVLNNIRCESHYELMLDSLKKKVYDDSHS